MNLSEKAKYLNGLMDGLGIDASTDTGKVLVAVKELLEELCEAVDGIDSDVDDVVDFCNAIDEDLHDIEEIVYDEHSHRCHERGHHPPMGDVPPHPIAGRTRRQQELEDEENFYIGSRAFRHDHDMFGDLDIEDIEDIEDEENAEDLRKEDGE